MFQGFHISGLKQYAGDCAIMWEVNPFADPAA